MYAEHLAVFLSAVTPAKSACASVPNPAASAGPTAKAPAAASSALVNCLGSLAFWTGAHLSPVHFPSTWKGRTRWQFAQAASKPEIISCCHQWECWQEAMEHRYNGNWYGNLETRNHSTAPNLLTYMNEIQTYSQSPWYLSKIGYMHCKRMKRLTRSSYFFPEQKSLTFVGWPELNWGLSKKKNQIPHAWIQHNKFDFQIAFSAAKFQHVGESILRTRHLKKGEKFLQWTFPTQAGITHSIFRPLNLPRDQGPMELTKNSRKERCWKDLLQIIFEKVHAYKRCYNAQSQLELMFVHTVLQTFLPLKSKTLKIWVEVLTPI